MKNISITSLKSRNQGFSLTELLMVVAILGIMAMLAIPTFGNTEPAKQGVHKQNAQNFCSLAIAISSAGVDLTGNVNFADHGSDDVKAVLRTMREGITVTDGTLAGRTFSIPNMDDVYLAGAAKYISIKNGELLYNGSLSL